MKRNTTVILSTILISTALSSFTVNTMADGYAYAATGVSDFDGEETDQSLALGAGLDITEHLAAELNFTNFGKVKGDFFNASNVDIKAETFSLAAVGSWPITEDLSVSGKLGLDIWETHLRVYNANGVFSYSNTEEGVSPYIAIGAHYQFDEQWGAMAEYQFHQFEIGSDDLDMGNFMIGVELYF